MIKTSQQIALSDAVDLAGSQSALARGLGVTQATVWKWLRRAKGASAEYVLAIESLTGISRHNLRADIYPLTDRGSPKTVGIPLKPDRANPRALSNARAA
jgi:DNA-binding transcriptional regulator YdaS (Cro superfamily)